MTDENLIATLYTASKTLEIPTMRWVESEAPEQRWTGGFCTEHGWWHGCETCPDCNPSPSE